MKDKNKTTINPEIKKKAKKLFRLIEEEVAKIGSEDTFAESASEQLGDFLKCSKGFDMLNYACDISKTVSETAVFCLEEATSNMNDEALKTITDLSKFALKAQKAWNDLKEAKSESTPHRLDIFLREATKAAEEVEIRTASEWNSRARCYREELKKLKEAS